MCLKYIYIYKITHSNYHLIIHHPPQKNRPLGFSKKNQEFERSKAIQTHGDKKKYTVKLFLFLSEIKMVMEKFFDT